VRVIELLERYPEGVAKKYEGRLRYETKREYNKIMAPAAPTPATVPAPVSALAPMSTPGAVFQALADVHATFKKWLGDDYDTDVLDVVLAAGAAERLTGDPLWLLVVSGSGAAKTETVQSLGGAGALVTSTIASEGALLSATARGTHATGGLLVRLGQRGVLVIKDMGTLLSMDIRARGVVFAALREIYDGRWERNVGIGGGRTLTWAGRIAVVGASTTAWDSAHSVITIMGDRFVIVRADSDATEGRIRSASKAIGNTGREFNMRAELAAAVGELLGNAGTSEYQLSEAEANQLTKLANIVTWVRTGVERDYRSEVVDAHALEMPTRFAKQLTQLVRGAVAIGVVPARAMQLAIRCARDSVVPLRRKLLLDIAAHPDTRSRDVARRIARPRMTVQRELLALSVLGALSCDEVDVMHGGRERVLAKYSLAPALDRELLLSM